MNYCPRLLAVGVFAFLAVLPIQAEVRVWEGSITLPTYPWTDDVNPRFFAQENSIIYPYNMQDDLSSEKVDRTYRALFLENEYLKVTCIPELGGRIHSVLDKSTNEEMFHTNKVIKPGLIAMRGAWISGGIEWNTGPHGHTVTIVSPVDAMTVRNADGSASLIVNNIEKIFRTRWTVKLTLHPGRSYLDEEIRIFNPTDGLHPYYFWNCTAFYNTDQTRFIYPMTLGTNHSGDSFFSWPEHEGKDITYLKNYDSPTSVFAWNAPFDFFGAYDVGMDRGIVQTANHRELIGKKAWTWGKSEDGIVSQRNLHDFNEEYIEVQSGPLLTQADYGLLEPHQEVAWQEYWYPVHGLGDGFEFANKDLAVQTIKGDGSLELRIMATGVFNNVDVSISGQDGEELRSERIDLSPRHPGKVVFSDLQGGDYGVEIRQSGALGPLVAFRTPLPIPVMEEPELPWWETKKDGFTVQETYLKGLLFDKQTNRPKAREWYMKVLEQDPLHTEAHRQLGILDLEAGLYNKAIEHFSKALQRNPDDVMSWYYLGSASLATGDLGHAEFCGFKVNRLLPANSIGYDLAGRAIMNQAPHRYPEGVAVLQKAFEKNPADSAVRNHLLLATMKARAAGHFIGKSLNVDFQDDPSDIVLRAIEYVANPSGSSFVSYLENSVGEVEFELIEAVIDFTEFGLFEQAYEVMQVIENPVLESKRSALSYYYLAWLAWKSGDKVKAREYLQIAGKQSPDYVFPSRVETIPVLEYAIHKNAQDANANLFLGNLLGGLGRTNEARASFQRATSLNPSLATAQRNLGYIAWHTDSNLPTAEKYYRLAIQARPQDQTLYRDLARVLIADNRREAAIALLEQMPTENSRTDITEILAQAYVDEQEYTKAIDLLADAFFSNWENRNVSRNVYVRAHIERGKLKLEDGDARGALQDFEASLLYPENLGVGRPANPREAESYYWIGRAYEALGQKQKALDAWERAATGPDRGPANQRDYVKKAREALKSEVSSGR